jgi:hypothetical protein
MPEVKGANNTSAEELSVHIVEVSGETTTVIPPVVSNLIAQLADAIGALDPPARAAAISHVAEFTKRLAG